MKFLALIALLPTIAMAGEFSGTYASDARDCRNTGPLNGEIVISADGLQMNELFCPTSEWRHVKTGYRAHCALEANTPKTITFSLKHQPNGALLYSEKDYSVILHRCN